MTMNKIEKAKTRRGKRELEKREPKIFENDKKTMFIKGGHTSETVTKTLKDLYALKKPNAVLYRRRNIMRPFEDQTSIEFFSNRNDASLFLFGSNSKKRPNNLVFGRLFDYQMLDMIELGIDHYKSMSEFKCAKIALATKPCLIFAGEPFEEDQEYKRLKSLFIDFFRGTSANKIRLAGLEHVFTFTAHAGKIYFRSYRILLKKSGSRTPRVELEEIGPSLDLIMRRSHLASDDLYKRALRQPSAIKPKKKKNISHDAFGTKEGRIHMQKQDLDKLQIRKMKGLKKRKSSEAVSNQKSKQKRLTSK